MAKTQSKKTVAKRGVANGLRAPVRGVQRMVPKAAKGKACVDEPKPVRKSVWHRFRSAITGLFVSRKAAQANPDTTVREKAR